MKKQQLTTRRAVQFAKEVEGFTIFPSNEWYLPKDYSRFDLDCKHDIRTFQNAMKRGTTKQQHAITIISPIHYNIRGLEGRASWGASRTMSFRRSAVVQNVLKEQYCQTQTGIKNDLQIASASSQSTFISQMEAIERALQDARDAGVIVETNDEEKNDQSYSFVPTSAGFSSCVPQQHQLQGQSSMAKKRKEYGLELELELKLESASSPGVV